MYSIFCSHGSWIRDVVINPNGQVQIQQITELINSLSKKREGKRKESNHRKMCDTNNYKETNSLFSKNISFSAAQCYS